MINKIENWESVEPNYGGIKRLPAGGYICQILAVTMEKSKAGNDMMVVNFDIADGDNKKFFLKKYNDQLMSTPDEKKVDVKWGGKYYIVLNVDGYEGKLKAFTTSVEESNTGYKWDWNEESLKNKLFGGIFREEEYEVNGEVRTSCKLWQVRSTQTIKDGEYEVPEKRRLSEKDKQKLAEASAPFTAGSMTQVTDDDLPF